jgi:hypothetical protein
LRDLIVCIAVMACGVALLLPVLNRLRSRPEHNQTNNNLKQMSLAIHSYNDCWRKLPPAFDKDGAPFPVSIHIHLFPFVEQDPLYKQYLAEGGVGKARMVIVPPYLSPSDWTAPGNGEGVQNFAGNLRLFSKQGVRTPYNASMGELAAVEPGEPGFRINRIQDGTSNTIAFATKYAICGNGGSFYAAEPSSKWAAFFGQNAALKSARPADAAATFQIAPGRSECRFTPLMAQSFGTGGLSVGIADGTVRRIHPDMSPETWNRAMHPTDGRDLGGDWNN